MAVPLRGCRKTAMRNGIAQSGKSVTSFYFRAQAATQTRAILVNPTDGIPIGLEAATLFEFCFE